MSYSPVLALFFQTVDLASEIAPQPRLYTLLLGIADERKSTSLKKTVDHLGRRWVIDVCWV